MVIRTPGKLIPVCILSYDKLCDELMLLTPLIAKVVVEHRDGYTVVERKRKSIIEMDDEKASFALLRGAQLVEKAKEYRKELGSLHFIIGNFDKLQIFLFPLRDYHSLVILTEPTIRNLTFADEVAKTIAKSELAP